MPAENGVDLNAEVALRAVIDVTNSLLVELIYFVRGTLRSQYYTIVCDLRLCLNKLAGTVAIANNVIQQFVFRTPDGEGLSRASVV